jgi:SAM-dependent methyltransferase
VGCGRGDFLRVAQRQGFSGTGCDIFGGRIPVSEGLVFFDGTLQEAKFPDNFFDIVVVRNIFEHLFNPNAEIQEIRRILKPAGYLYLKVPNVDFEHGLRCWFMFGKPHSFDPPYHLNHFSQISLQRFLHNADFTLISWYLEQPTLLARRARNLARQAGYRVSQAIRFLSGGVVFPKPLLSCFAQKR